VTRQSAHPLAGRAFRLAIYSYNYAPEPTGIPYYNTAMASWLHRRLGWEVTVHTGLPHYPWWRVPDDYAAKDYRFGKGDEVIDGVIVERVRHFVPCAPVGALGRMRLDASWLWATTLRSMGLQRRPDAIMIISPPFLAGLLGLLLRWRHRAPVIYHVQDLQIDAAIELGMLPASLARLLTAIERLILSQVDLVTTVSQGMRQRLAAKTRTRRPLALFPNWTDAEAMQPWHGANRFRDAWQLPAATVVVMYSGSLGRKQGVDLLLEAVHRLGDGVHLVIAGDGAERAQLEEAARGLPGLSVRFLPLVAAGDLREFLSAADIHCIPQRRAAEGLVMPSKLLNIMAVARPVVVTATAGSDLAEEVRRSAGGVVAEPEDAALLAEALRALCADQPRRVLLGGNARTHVISHFASDSVLQRFAHQLLALVRERAQAHADER
jgi:colanic acid biosynthesis glycosyl transferase WcaI